LFNPCVVVVETDQALKDEIKAMHGLRIFTDVPRK